MIIRYIFSLFGMFYQEKSGKPGPDGVAERRTHLSKRKSMQAAISRA
jgi:hypothetical protein